MLAYKLIMFKPPADNIAGKNKTSLYYFGYNEKGMISLYVNLVAAVSSCWSSRSTLHCISS